MFSGIGLFELAGGALIVLGIFIAFMVWAVFALLPFAIMGIVYATVRYGVPALARSAAYAADGVVEVVRWVLTPVAVWALRGPQPAYERGDGQQRR